MIGLPPITHNRSTPFQVIICTLDLDITSMSTSFNHVSSLLDSLRIEMTLFPPRYLKNNHFGNDRLSSHVRQFLYIYIIERMDVVERNHRPGRECGDREKMTLCPDVMRFYGNGD